MAPDDFKSPDRDNGETSLHKAAMFGNASFIPALIAEGADVNAQTKEGVTPLHFALNREVADILLANGARVDMTAYGVFTPLLLVSVDEHRLRYETQKEIGRVTELIKTLVAHGADINARGEDGNTLLHQLMHTKYEFEPEPYIQQGHEQIVRCVLAMGASVHARNDEGQTPLHMIMSWDCFSQALIDYGAMVDDEDDSGMTPLRSLMTWFDWYGGFEQGGERHIRQLVSYGANINHKDPDGWTVLHHVARGLQCDDPLPVARLLVSLGADVLAQTNDGKTPLEIALSEDNSETAEYLRTILPA